MKRERAMPARSKDTAEAPEVEEIVADETDAGLLSDIDELLDEIDSVLEEQSVLVNYRQRSGQ